MYRTESGRRPVGRGGHNRESERNLGKRVMGVEREVDVATYTRDVRRKPGDSKMPSMKPVYLYPEARARFPGLPSQSVSSIEQTCQLKYRAMRYNVIWTSAVALPVFRYPTPFPTHNQSWSVAMENDAPIVSLRIGSVRYRLRLKTGAQFHRQFIAVRQLVAGAQRRAKWQSTSAEMPLWSRWSRGSRGRPWSI